MSWNLDINYQGWFLMNFWEAVLNLCMTVLYFLWNIAVNRDETFRFLFKLKKKTANNTSLRTIQSYMCSTPYSLYPLRGMIWSINIICCPICSSSNTGDNTSVCLSVFLPVTTMQQQTEPGNLVHHLYMVKIILESLLVYTWLCRFFNKQLLSAVSRIVELKKKSKRRTSDPDVCEDQFVRTGKDQLYIRLEG